ncbi:unnamed protein product [Hydatigera taeniaeformis]|uniref:Trichohyalin-plectin-homology domain-containing protein n=1 Tax=Hydatigena taeniaeformis TaxID=6205 RepID=A0A3P7GZC2_HYDTA|nr:unnamed protein product [Hydatigera taeniaeformis]
MEEIDRRKKEMLSRRQEEIQFEAKKLLEQEALDVVLDSRRNPWIKSVEANRKRQELAALKLIEMRNAEEDSLLKRAAKASTEIRIGRAILESAQEADQEFIDLGQRAKQQCDYRSDLDCVLGLKKNAIKEERDREKELDRMYLEACKQEEAKLRKENDFQRAVGLEFGQYLRVGGF